MSDQIRGTVRANSREIGSAAEVNDLLAPLRGKPGWVCFASGWEWWSADDGSGPASGPRGLPLAAEFVLSDTASVQLRRWGDGWLWTRIEEDLSPNAAHADRAHDIWLISSVRPTDQAPLMGYRIWWQRSNDDADEPVRPLMPGLARFLGWKAREE